MITPEKFIQLKDKIDQLEKESSKSEGILQQLKTNVKKEFDCDNLKKAEILLENMKQELERDKEKYEEDLASFESKWKGKL